MKRPIVRKAAWALAGIIPMFQVSRSAPAQQVISAKAGLVYHIEGDVLLEGKKTNLAADKYPQLQNGQTLRTKQGRAELILGPNIFFRLGASGLLRMEQNVIADAQLSLLQGFSLIEIVETIKGNRVRLNLSHGAVEVSKAGLYRVDANSLEVRVYGGEAMVERNGNKFMVKSGRMLCLDNNLKPTRFDVEIADSFHQWAGRRSFDLFVAFSNPLPYDHFYVPAAPKKQAHWQLDAVGWLANARYRMRFFSAKHYSEWNFRRQKERLSPPLFKQDLEMPSPSAPAPTPSIKTM